MAASGERALSSLPFKGEEEEDLEPTASRGDEHPAGQIVNGHLGTMVEISIRSMRESWLQDIHGPVGDGGPENQDMRALPTREVKAIIRTNTKRNWWAPVVKET